MRHIRWKVGASGFLNGAKCALNQAARDKDGCRAQMGGVCSANDTVSSCCLLFPTRTSSIKYLRTLLQFVSGECTPHFHKIKLASLIEIRMLRKKPLLNPWIIREEYVLNCTLKQKLLANAYAYLLKTRQHRVLYLSTDSRGAHISAMLVHAPGVERSTRTR